MKQSDNFVSCKKCGFNKDDICQEHVTDGGEKFPVKDKEGYYEACDEYFELWRPA